MSALFLFAAVLPAPEEAGSDQFPVYTGPEFVALYEYAVDEVLPNLAPPVERLPVTGDAQLDERIWRRALRRGYLPRPVVASAEGLVRVDGVPMQPQAAQAWLGLKEEARAAGLHFIVSSAYRSPQAQRNQFLSRLEGRSDAAIDAALTWYSIPGTSKHHSGYALDFRYRDGTFGEFRQTPDYAWLAADNFHNAKRFGLIPSYPDDAAGQGPNPEPWEFVWVGVDLIRCGIPLRFDPALFGPHTELVAEWAACPGQVRLGRLAEVPPHVVASVGRGGLRG